MLLTERGVDVLEDAVSRTLADFGIDSSAASVRAAIATHLRRHSVVITEEGAPVLDAVIVEDEWVDDGPIDF